MQDRCVTGEDYKALIDQFVSPYNGMIGKSTISLRGYGCSANIVDAYVLAKFGDNGLTQASDQLKSELIDYINTKKMITDLVCIRDGSIIVVDVTLEITVNKAFRKQSDELNTKINLKINNFFSLSNWDYGESLKDTDIMRILSDMKEITDISVTLTTESGSGSLVTARYFEIVRPDSITVNTIFE